MKIRYSPTLVFFVLCWALVACRTNQPETQATAVPPTATAVIPPTPATLPADDNYLIIATDAPNPPFTNFDKYGTLIGFEPDILQFISNRAGFEGYELVVTPHQGVLESLANHTTQDFDAVMSGLVIPDTPPEGIVYTHPYLEVGQVLVVLADNPITTPQELAPDSLIGVQKDSASEEAAHAVLGIDAAQIQTYDIPEQALQAMVDGQLQGVVLDSSFADYYTKAYPLQLRAVGGVGKEGWITGKSYGIAVAATNTALLERLNSAIDALTADNTITQRVFMTMAAPFGSIDAGESRVGTLSDELVIGLVGELTDMDPSGPPNLINWEAKNNTMSGLYRLDPTGEIVPLLAAGTPLVSADKLQYTIPLKAGLTFPDGSEFNADDVQWSVLRSARLGSFLVNAFLKDSNGDGFADEDAVQVIDSQTVRFVLQAPTPYFTSLLAIPPYFPVSSDCFAAALDSASTCGGIGPYTIENWTSEQMRLTANPTWPGTPPTMTHIVLRFYQDLATLQQSLQQYQSVDVVWTGASLSVLQNLGQADGNGDSVPDYVTWLGPAIFKSYLVFEQKTPPWDKPQARQAVAYALDRSALAALFGDGRLPLLSPIPSGVPGAVDVFPARDLQKAQDLLLEVGYSPSKPLPIKLWYLNDGRYSAIEDQYALAIKQQLEETNVFQVSLESEAWGTYQGQINACQYPLYLMGWPSPSQTPNYFDATSWTDFFLQNTSSGICSNYTSTSMTALTAAAEAELDPTARQALLGQIQALWAKEYPTLELTQEPRRAVSLPKVQNVVIDGMGLMHYELLSKN